MKKITTMLKKTFKNFDPKIKEECGVFGISNYEDASALTALGLHALQHRGQEGCGIVSFNGKEYFSEIEDDFVLKTYSDALSVLVRRLEWLQTNL